MQADTTLGLAPVGTRVRPIDLAGSIESYSLSGSVPLRLMELIWAMLGPGHEEGFDLSNIPASAEVVELKSGLMLDAVRSLDEYGSLREAEGAWIRSRAMWIWYKLRLWECDDTMTQKQSIFNVFGIGKTSFWMRVRAVEALENVHHIPFDTITSCPHSTVWYALADRILADEPWLVMNPATGEMEPVNDDQIMDWLISDLGANDLVAVITGYEPNIDQQIDRLIGQATAMESLLRDRGIMLVQSDQVEFANVGENGIIHGHDIISGESIHVVSSPHGAAIHTYCPRCGSEIDPAELVIREEEDIGD